MYFQGSFGELALLYNQARAANVTARTATVLWAIDRSSFLGVIQGTNARRKKLYEKFLRGFTLLGPLEPDDIIKVADALVSMQFNQGDVIIKGNLS